MEGQPDKRQKKRVHNVCILNTHKIPHLSGYIDNIVGMSIRSLLIENGHIYFNAILKVRLNTKLKSVIGADLRTGIRVCQMTQEYTITEYRICRKLPTIMQHMRYAISDNFTQQLKKKIKQSCASSEENDNKAGQVCMNYEEPFLITTQNKSLNSRIWPRQ
uniref:Uncharacterized protein n=1 Tax=Glossina austeni TaxID=7395 RepID=A0A1A9UVN3_GLOAU